MVKYIVLELVPPNEQKIGKICMLEVLYTAPWTMEAQTIFVTRKDWENQGGE